MTFGPSQLPALAILGAMLLFGLAASVVSLLKARREAEALQARLADVTVQHGPTRPLAGPRRKAKGDGSRHVETLLRIAGYSPDRRAQYPLAWWAVVLIAVAAARGVSALGQIVLGPFALLLMPLEIWFMARGYWRFYDNRRRAKLYEQLPDALGSIVRTVRVGIPVVEALRAVAINAPEPTAEEFRQLTSQVQIGTALEKTLTDIAGRSGVAEYRFFATAIALQAQTGGGLTETLEILADVIRKRIALRKRGYALAAEARTSAGLLAALPFITGAMLAVVNPSYIVLLFTDVTGQKVLLAAIALLTIGFGTMKLMIKKSLS